MLFGPFLSQKYLFDRYPDIFAHSPYSIGCILQNWFIKVCDIIMMQQVLMPKSAGEDVRRLLLLLKPVIIFSEVNILYRGMYYIEIYP